MLKIIVSNDRHSLNILSAMYLFVFAMKLCIFISPNCLQSSNKFDISKYSVSLFTFKELSTSIVGKLIYVMLEQPENIEFIAFNDAVLNVESKLFKELHPENIDDISLILLVLKPFKLTDVKLSQPENIDLDELTSNVSNWNSFIVDISLSEAKKSSKFVTLYLKYISTVALAGMVNSSSGFIILLEFP